jgi:hypothetical protein
MRRHFSRTSTVLFLAMLALASGCGSSDDSGDTGAPVPDPSPTIADMPPGPVDAGCSSDFPRAGTERGALASTFTTCSTTDGRGLRLQNVSRMTLRVSSPGDAGLTPMKATPESISAALVASAAPLSCDSGGCTIPPGASVEARGTAPVGVNVAVAVAEAGYAVALAQLGDVLESRLLPSAVSYRLAAYQCARSIASLDEAVQTTSDAVRQVLGSSDDCLTLLKLPADPDAPHAPLSLTDEVERYSIRIAKETAREGYVAALGRMLVNVAG